MLTTATASREVRRWQLLQNLMAQLPIYSRKLTIQERIDILEARLEEILLKDGACVEIEETCRQIHILRWRRKYLRDLNRMSQHP